MNHPTPVVSIIIPAYQVAPYIAAAIESVLKQTWTSYEIIVVNDGSPDTAALEAALAPYRDRMIYRVQPNRGAGAARNTAIQAARGTWLAFLDADDLWEPGFLASQLDLLEQGGYDMVYANSRLFGEGNQSGRTCMDMSPSEGTPDLEGLLSLRCQPITSTTVVRRQLVMDAGGFDEAILRGQDFDLWVRLAQRGARIGYQRTVLGSYRRRADSLSGLDERGLIDRELNLYRTLRGKLADSATARHIIDGQVDRLTAARELAEAKAELVAGNYPAAARRFKSAWQQRRSLKLLLTRLLLPVAPGLLRSAYLRRHRQ